MTTGREDKAGGFRRNPEGRTPGSVIEKKGTKAERNSPETLGTHETSVSRGSAGLSVARAR